MAVMTHLARVQGAGYRVQGAVQCRVPYSAGYRVPYRVPYRARNRARTSVRTGPEPVLEQGQNQCQ